MAGAETRKKSWHWLQVALVGLLTLKLILAGFGVGRDWLGRPASAQDEKAVATSEKKESQPQTADQPKKEAEPTQATLSPAQMELLRSMEEQKRRLEAQEKELTQKRQDLLALQAEIDQKMTALQKLRQEFEAQVAAEKARHNERIKHLVALYSNMKPQAAAAVMEKLDFDIAVEIFRQMRGREAGKILAQINPDKASRISKMLSEAPPTKTP